MVELSVSILLFSLSRFLAYSVGKLTANELVYVLKQYGNTLSNNYY